MTTTDRSSLVTLGAMLLGLCAFVVFGASSVSAHSGNDNGTHHATGTKATSTKTVDLTCMQTAVNTRESAVGAAYTKHATHITNALTARKNALNSAWGMSDKTARNTAIKSAWKTYRDSKMSSRKDMNSARKSAWTEFKKTAKTDCKEVVPKDEGEKSDSDV
jgi:hypothetical protein